MKLLIILIALVSALNARAFEVDCRVVELKGAQVADNTFRLDMDVKILTFDIFEEYIATVMWPQDSKNMTIVYGKVGYGLISESTAPIKAPEDSLNTILHISADEKIKILCLAKR